MASKKPRRTHSMAATALPKQAVFDNYYLVKEVCMFLSHESLCKLTCTSRTFRKFVLSVKRIDNQRAMKFSKWLARANCDKFAWTTSRSLVSERRLHMEVALDETSLQQVEDNFADFSCIRHLTVRNVETTWLSELMEHVAHGNVTRLRFFLFPEGDIFYRDQLRAFTSIGSCLTQSRTLSWLEFRHCSLLIETELMELLVEGVLKCPTLTGLNLCGIYIAHDVVDYMDSIKRLVLAPSSLTYLNLHNCYLDYECIEILSAALKDPKRSTCLTELDLTENEINDDAAVLLAGAIIEAQTLRTLQIWGNWINDKGMVSLASIAKHSSAFKTLGLGCCLLREESAKKIADSLQASETFETLIIDRLEISVQDVVGRTPTPSVDTLRRLNFSENEVDNMSVMIIGHLMVHNTKLTLLDLSWNTDIESEGYAVLGRCIAANHSLTCLDLTRNICGDEGVIALVTAGAPQNETLTNLELCGNEIGGEGVAAIANWIQGTKVLTCLDLSFNHVNVDGALALADALTKNQSLTSLNLSENDIGDKGAAAVATWIQKTKVLAHLILCFNNIDLEGALALAEALPKNRSLTSLILWGNVLGGEPGARALATAIKKSPMIEKAQLDALLLPIKDLREETEFTLDYYCDEYLGYFDLILLTSVMTQCTSLTLIGDRVSNDEEFLVMAVVEATKQCKYLKKMEFHSNHLSDKNAVIVVRAVADHAALETLYFGCMELPIQDLCNRTSETTLDFSSSDITFPSIRHESTIKVLGNLLARNTTATHLSLSSNPGIADWKAIIQGFKSNTSLKSVDLSNINCDAETIIGLSRAFKGNMVLTELDLNCNAIVDEGAAAVATWIEEGACLKKLILSYNQIGNPGAIALAESIKKTGVLDYLELDENCIEDDGVLALVQRSGESLQYLNLDENPYGEIGSAARRAVYGEHSNSEEDEDEYE